MMAHMLGSGPANGVVQQQQRSGCGQLILARAEMAGFQPFRVKTGTHET